MEKTLASVRDFSSNPQKSVRKLYYYKSAFPKERNRSKQVNILISKAILFILQNMFQNIHTSFSLAKSIIKTVNVLNLHVS